MKQLKPYFSRLALLVPFMLAIWDGFPEVGSNADLVYMPPPDTTVQQTPSDLPFPLTSPPDNPGAMDQPQSSIDFQDPSIITEEVIYDPVTNQYIIYKKIGDIKYRTPRTMTFEEYMDYRLENSLDNYWRERMAATLRTTDSDGLIPQIAIGSEVFERIFGGSTIDIRPQGSAELIFGVRSNSREDPALDVRRRRTTNFDFQQKIQMNVTAKIGENIDFTANFNTEATFDFENEIKLKYQGQEDDILRLVEAGYVNFPLNNSLIQGSQNLFGIKTELQFGRTRVTGVFSQQKSESRSITVQGGAQTTEFRVRALDYEDNRHFFLSQYFRDNYERALESLPIISSNLNITKIEVWVTTRGPAVTENRNLVAFMDLAEYAPYNPNITPFGLFPENYTNDLLVQLDDTARLRNINTVSEYLSTHPLGLVSGRDFEKIANARKLSSNEFTFNDKLGFISLNYQLNPDQVLAVAYQYTIIGQGDKIYQVGEFSDGGITSPQTLMVKMLKSTAVDTRVPMWDLMMKNIYSLNAFRVNREDFTLNILYSGGVNSVPTGYLLEGPPDVEGVPLIRVMGFDRLDQQFNPPPDGLFDFLDNAATGGGTIQSTTGRIYFPSLEPFGSYLRRKLEDPELGDKYAFDSLYTMTKTMAAQFPDRNRFFMDGMYKSESGSEISLNAINVPAGSVRVTAGGTPLVENVHYTVDYTLGRVRIIDEGIMNSGTPINISLESTSMFSILNRRMMGARVEHVFSPEFYVAGTILNLHERPLTQKVSIGNEPISNTIWGIDFGYQKEALFITDWLNKLPFYSSNTPSRITLNGEFAQFIPGYTKVIGEGGVSYIDDFEGSKSTIDLKNIGNWFLASTPQHQTWPFMFPEAAPGTGLQYGFNRAQTAWYIIDPLFYESSSNLRPPNIDRDELSRHSVRAVRETEVFPNANPPSGQPMNIPVFNIAFYPSTRGPYNYDTRPVPGISQGVNADGTLRDPETRWGGIMRALETTDFEATNIEYIGFWMMDPFAEDSTHSGGFLFFNLGDISEDLLRDGRNSFENGLPTGPEVINVDTTIWGRVPSIQPLVYAFDNDPSARQFQDVGYDGLSDDDERSFFEDYLRIIAETFGQESEAYQLAFNDPSSDNYHYFRGSNFDQDNTYRSISMRYKRFNNPERNSPTANQSPESFPTQGTSLPNFEDINRDNTLNEAERYYQYWIELRPDQMEIGSNYITDILHAVNIPLENGTRGNVKWYQFKIPVRSPDLVVGNIQDFRSIRFMRTFLKGWNQEVILRFATFELVRTDWRRYYNELFEPGDFIPSQNETQFDISTVNIEANGFRSPIPYVLPPGIEREVTMGTTQLQERNEQSLAISVCNLADGDARGVFKTTDFDFRQFERVQMFVHAEKSIEQDELKTGDLTAFIRIGSDFTANYYEYEVPLEFTPWNTSDPVLIWPENNNFDIELEKFVEAKRLRNEAMKNPESLVSTSTPFQMRDGDNMITVVGFPTLSEVKAIMLGIRNPKKRSVFDDDDGLPKCAEIWFNELRLTNFNDQSGWAATARMNTLLADLGNVMVSGSYSTSGFGSLENRVSDRQMETFSQFDIATNLQLGRFFPENFGLRIPMHFDYSEARIKPKFNPLDPDVLFKDAISDVEKSEQDSLRRVSEGFIQRKNINFMNVRKERTGTRAKAYIWDIENFDFSYAYSMLNRRDINLEFDNRKTHRAGIGYNYGHNPKNYRPFTSFTKIKLINDFNFYLLPRSFSYRTDMFREYGERLIRNKSAALIKIETNFMKRWDWNRFFDIKWDLTQALKFEYNSTSNSFIREPAGAVDRESPDFPSYRDSVWQQIRNFGTLTGYNHNFSVNYMVPINKIPLFDWINLNTRYTAMYRWQATPLSIQQQLGNTIENNAIFQINSNLRFTTLYNKVDYLKKLNQPPRRQPQRPPPTPPRRNDQAEQEEEEKEKENQFGKIMKTVGNTLVRIIISLKDGSISYTDNRGTLLPGFMPEPNFMGIRTSDNAPGLGFVFGSQEDIRPEAIMKNWISTDTLLNSPYMTRASKNLNVRANLEPFPMFRIDLTADRTEAYNFQEFFRVGPDGNFNSFAPQRGGNFSMSYILWATSFTRDLENHSNPTFEEFRENRIIIANRLAAENQFSQGFDSLGYPDGYGASQQDVMLYSFISTYAGRDPSTFNLNPFPAIPLPNWRVTYNGLTQIDFFRKYFRSFTISHAYRSVYNVGSFVSNLEYMEDGGIRNSTGNFISQMRIDVVNLTEQFSPLINFDMVWNNSLLTRLEIRHSRNLSFSFVNNQLTEATSKEYLIGLGYRIQDLRFLVTALGGRNQSQRISSELNLKLDISWRDNKTVLRRTDQNVDQISSGQQLVAINFSADYMFSRSLTARAFFERSSTNPFISNQFPTSTTYGGISLRFTLMQ